MRFKTRAFLVASCQNKDAGFAEVVCGCMLLHSGGLVEGSCSGEECAIPLHPSSLLCPVWMKAASDRVVLGCDGMRMMALRGKRR